MAGLTKALAGRGAPADAVGAPRVGRAPRADCADELTAGGPAATVMDPAQAGMDHPNTTRPGATSRDSRARGNGPYSADAQSIALPAPRTRGYPTATCNDVLMPDWIMDAPSRARHDYPTAVAAWVAHICPAHLTRAVESLSTHPKGAALVAGRTLSAMLDARGREETGDDLSMSVVIPAGVLDGLLPDEDIAFIRAMQVPVDVSTPTEELTRRVEMLRAEWPRLPRHMLDPHQPRA